jgi:hypothetical protein
MWAAITAFIGLLYKLSGIPGWLHDRELRKEGEYDQQFSDIKAQQKQEAMAQAASNSVDQLSDDDVKRVLLSDWGRKQ